MTGHVEVVKRGGLSCCFGHGMSCGLKIDCVKSKPELKMHRMCEAALTWLRVLLCQFFPFVHWVVPGDLSIWTKTWSFVSHARNTTHHSTSVKGLPTAVGWAIFLVAPPVGEPWPRASLSPTVPRRCRCAWSWRRLSTPALAGEGRRPKWWRRQGARRVIAPRGETTPPQALREVAQDRHCLRCRAPACMYRPWQCRRWWKRRLKSPPFMRSRLPPVSW